MIDIVEGADRDDRGKDEQDHRDASDDQDVARQAALLLFSNDLADGGQIDISRRAFQSFRSFPRSLRARISDCVARICFDPGANVGFVLGSRIAVKLCQQARGFRLDLFPAV